MQIRNGRTTPPPSLDALDNNIIEILRTNGRATNQDIAQQLSVTAATDCVTARVDWVRARCRDAGGRCAAAAARSVGRVGST